MKRIINNFCKNGYVVINLFKPSQIDKFKKKVCDNLNKVQSKKNFSMKTLQSYHKTVNDENLHKKIVKAERRNISFDSLDIKTIIKNKFINLVTKNFWGHNKFSIKLVVDKSSNNKSVFRLARPYAYSKKDVGGYHVDMHYAGKIRKNYNELFTIWTPLIGFSKKYSLKLSPKSHLINHNIKDIVKQKLYISKIFKLQYANRFYFKRLNLKKGQSILFHPNLLHGGSVNLGKKTRVSMDFRIYNSKIK
jgi:ectoine hydroxylase-related dioxygenase (phytanoyl-CoA dioxygenase family)